MATHGRGQPFDRCLSLKIDGLHNQIESARQWPVSQKKVKRLSTLRKRLRSLERRIPA